LIPLLLSTPLFDSFFQVGCGRVRAEDGTFCMNTRWRSRLRAVLLSDGAGSGRGNQLLEGVLEATPRIWIRLDWIDTPFSSLLFVPHSRILPLVPFVDTISFAQPRTGGSL